jgi:hypothetical protein
MASRLGGFEALSQDPVMEVEEEMEKDPLDTKSIRQEMEEYIVLEEDPELCAMSVTVNVKIVVLNDNSSNLTF